MLSRQPHDSMDMLYDQKFTYSLMKLAKVSQLRRWRLSDLLFQSDKQKSIEDYIFVSPAPAEVAAKYATNVNPFFRAHRIYGARRAD